jgi:16S rRNA (cytosine1402-N4)-methyltransferase
MHQNKKPKIHVPVLLDEVVAILNPQKGDKYLDLTAGYGGHAKEILSRTQAPKSAIFVDRDQNAINVLGKDKQFRGVKLIHKDFLSATKELALQGSTFNVILVDLGLSSPHLDIASRGFSVSKNGPLDMRMDQRQPITARELVNNSSIEELELMLKTYGEEPKAKQIARLIVENRPINTTEELARLVARAWRGPSRIHPATRTFQALRIAVNNELQQLSEALPLWLELLAPSGRLGVISFHSLEDRIVKQVFADNGRTDDYEAKVTILTKRPIVSGQHELDLNPRARSAKLRACKAKIKKKGDRRYANYGKKPLPSL